MFITAPPSIIFINHQVTRNQYADVIFQCVAVGYPLPKLKWMFGSYELIDNSFENTINTKEILSELVLNSITLSERGNYTCYAENSEGSDSAIVELTVQGRKIHKPPQFQTIIAMYLITAPPHVTTDETEMTVVAGSNMTLTCHIIAFPEPYIWWSRNMMNSAGGSISEIVQNSDVYTFSTLVLLAVTLFDNDVYICLANNSIGNGEISIHVIVQGEAVRIMCAPC